jgi:hypothetical protein
MHPLLSQAVAEAHRQDLLREAQRRPRRAAVARQPNRSNHASWNAKMGSMLIRLGTHLAADQPQPHRV